MAKSVFKELRDFVLMVSVVLGVSVSPYVIKSYIDGQVARTKVQDTEQFGSYMKYFQKTEYDVVTKMIIKDPISVIIDEMDDVSKKHIIDAINSLDDISQNINYNIYDSQNYKNSNDVKCIKIKLVDKCKEPSAAGQTIYAADNYTGKIMLPIEIQINEQFKDEYFDDERTDSVLTTIVKHELLHTLGFIDLYDADEKDKSIMYYKADDDGAHTYTEQDKNVIQYVYDGTRQVTITTPMDFTMEFVPTSNKVVEFLNKENDDINIDDENQMQ